MLPLTYWPDERLVQKCEPVKQIDDAFLLFVESLKKTMLKEQGLGIAATQVGVPLQVCLVQETYGEEPLVMINPVIEASSKKKVLFGEGCLSFPGLFIEVARPAWVDVAYLDLNMKRHLRRFDGLPLSVCVQHEIDHLRGLTFLDRVSRQERRKILRKWKQPWTEYPPPRSTQAKSGSRKASYKKKKAGRRKK